MANKNIYIFTNSYLPILGGIQTVSSQLACNMRAKGYNVTVMTCLYPKKLRITEIINGIKIWRLPFILPHNITDRVLYLIVLSCLFMIFLLRRPSTVYVHFPLEQSDYIRILKHLFKYDIITCFHGHDVLRYYEGADTNSRVYNAQKKLIESSKAVTACSRFLADTVNKVFNISNTVSIYNGVDLSRFNNKTSRHANTGSYIFAFGRLEKIKGFDILISAFAKADIPKSCQLLIAGDGTMKDSLYNQITNLNIQSRIKLIGRLTPDEIAEYSSNAYFNVIPSLRESFGIVALEAIASKRPVIASNRGGIPEIVTSTFGVLCEPDEQDMKRAIEYVYRNIDKFGNPDESDKYLQQFSIENMTKSYLEAAEIFEL